MERYVCIHGHFYPPRRAPWLEAIELQDSAHPYHDWNESKPIRHLETTLRVRPFLPFQVNIWLPQNTFYEAMTPPDTMYSRAVVRGDSEAAAWRASVWAAVEIPGVRGEWEWAEVAA